MYIIVAYLLHEAFCIFSQLKPKFAILDVISLFSIFPKQIKNKSLTCYIYYDIIILKITEKGLKDMANFYLVCGISGGGKTMLSKRIIEKNKKIKIYDVDEYYAKINGDECIHEKTFDVWISLFQDLHKSELMNEDVLLTTNALTVSQRNQFVEWFPTFKHHMLWVTAPKEKCIEGNQSRRRQVPLEKLLKGWENMEFPNANERGWDSIAQITNCWDNENYIVFNLKGNIENLISI